MGNNVPAFIAKLQSDLELRERFEAVCGLPIGERLAGLLALLAEFGIPVSVSDLKDFVALGEGADAALASARYPLFDVLVPGAQGHFQEFLKHFRVRDDRLTGGPRVSEFVEDTEVQREIHAAVALLDLKSEAFHKLPAVDAETAHGACFRGFVKVSHDVRWWWEYFREPMANFCPGGNSHGLESVLECVPSADDPCYFIVEDDRAPFYPVYVTTPRNAVAVLLECFGFEFYLVSLDLSWLICENHHNEIFGVGESVISKIRGLRSSAEE